MPFRDSWDLSGRDVVPDLAVAGKPSDPGAAILYALLEADGVAWAPPYDDFRSLLGVRAKAIEPEREEQSNSRLRTWLVYFRSLGLVREAEGQIRVTELGRGLHDMLSVQYGATSDFSRELSRSHRWRLARMIGPALARYQLRNPFTANDYTPDVDIHPLWAMWRVMRSLDNKLHWDEFDRTLTTCLKMADIDGVISAIAAARAEPDYDPSDEALLERLLGPQHPVAASQHDRVLTWFSRAAFKDIFLELRSRTDGFRYLQDEFLPLIDELLTTPPDDFAGTEEDKYVEWLGSAGIAISTTRETTSTEVVAQVVERCRRFGDRQVVALVGAAGVGKTTSAREAALVLTEGDADRVRVVQFHAAFTYEEFVGGLAPTDDGHFEPTPGALVETNQLALDDPGNTYVLLIDELSRADTANVLGEFLTYVEYRDRSFWAPGLRANIRLAKNLVVIATMNPADRSVVNMDDALVRRLRFVHLGPDVAALESILAEAGMADDLRSQVAAWFESLPPDVPFGHGLFVDVVDEADLYDLWHEKLVFFLRRGGLSMYRDPHSVEDGFVWRSETFRRGYQAIDVANDALPVSDASAPEEESAAREP